MNTEKRRTFIINFIYFLILAVVSWLVIKYCFMLLSPFIIAFVIAYILQKPISAFSSVTKLNRNFAAVLLTTAFFGIIGLLTALLGIKIISWISDLISLLPKIYTTHIVPALTDAFMELEAAAKGANADIFKLLSYWENEIVNSLGDWISGISVSAMSSLSDVVSSLPNFIVEFVLVITATYFIAADYNRMMASFMGRLGNRPREIIGEIKKYLIGTLFVCLRSYIFIMSITFVELSIALVVIKMEHAVLIAFLTAICDILPVLGTGTVMIPWAIIAAISGRTVLGIQLIVIYFVITVIRNIIEPKIVGSQLGLSPVVTLASMFAGAKLFGVVGLFGFPIGLSLFRYLCENGTIKLGDK